VSDTAGWYAPVAHTDFDACFFDQKPFDDNNAGYWLRANINVPSGALIHGLVFGFDGLNGASNTGYRFVFNRGTGRIQVDKRASGAWTNIAYTSDGTVTDKWTTFEVFNYPSIGSAKKLFDCYWNGHKYFTISDVDEATVKRYYGYHGVYLEDITSRVKNIEIREASVDNSVKQEFVGFPGFYDHFDGTSFDSNIWTDNGGAASEKTMSRSIMSLRNAGGAYGDLITKRKWMYGRMAWYGKLENPSGDTLGFIDSSGTSCVRFTAGNFRTDNGSTGTTTAVTVNAGAYVLIEIQWDPNICRMYVDGQLVASHTATIPTNIWLPIRLFAGDTTLYIRSDWLGVVGAHGLKNIDHLSLGTAASVSSRYFSAGTEVGNQYSVQMLSPGRIIGCQFRGSTTGETTAIKNVAPVYFVEGDEISCYINYVMMSDTVLEVHKNGSVQSVFSTAYSMSDKRNENWNGTILVEYL
jgi:hypothetical protein